MPGLGCPGPLRRGNRLTEVTMHETKPRRNGSTEMWVDAESLQPWNPRTDPRRNAG